MVSSTLDALARARRLTEAHHAPSPPLISVLPRRDVGHYHRRRRRAPPGPHPLPRPGLRPRGRHPGHRLRHGHRRPDRRPGRAEAGLVRAGGRQRAGAAGHDVLPRRRLRGRRQVQRPALRRGVRPPRLRRRLGGLPTAAGGPVHRGHPGRRVRRPPGGALGAGPRGRATRRHGPHHHRRQLGRRHHGPVRHLHRAGARDRRHLVGHGGGHGPVGRAVHLHRRDDGRRAAAGHRPRHGGYGRALPTGPGPTGAGRGGGRALRLPPAGRRGPRFAQCGRTRGLDGGVLLRAIVARGAGPAHGDAGRANRHPRPPDRPGAQTHQHPRPPDPACAFAHADRHRGQPDSRPPCTCPGRPRASPARTCRRR